MPLTPALSARPLIHDSDFPPATCARESHPFPREGQLGVEQNTTTDSRCPRVSVPRPWKFSARDTGKAFPQIPQSRPHRSRASRPQGTSLQWPYLATAPGVEVCNTRGPPRSQNTWPGPAPDGQTTPLHAFISWAPPRSPGPAPTARSHLSN